MKQEEDAMQKIHNFFYAWLFVMTILTLPTGASAVALMGTGNGTGSVSGTIINPTNVTGNIFVTLKTISGSMPLYGATVAKDGTFTVSHIPDGTYDLSATIDVAGMLNGNDLYGSFRTFMQTGYGSLGPSVHGDQAVTIVGGASVSGQNLTFDIQVMTGKVVNSVGVGVAKVLVEAGPLSDGRWAGRPSDINGNFTLYLVPGIPGIYRFRFSTDYRNNSGGSPIHVPNLGGGWLVDNQGTLGDWNQAQISLFASGSTTLPLAAGLSVVLPAATELIGTIIDPNTGQGAAGVTVNVQPVWNSITNQPFSGINAGTITDVQGVYKLNVVDGIYNVRMGTGSLNPITRQPVVLSGVVGGVLDTGGILTDDQTLFQQFVFVVGQTPTPAVPPTITLLPATVVNGTVIDPTGNVVPGVEIQAQPAWNSQTGQQTGQGFRTTTDASGHYSLTLADGSYHIFIATQIRNPRNGRTETIPGMSGGYIDAYRNNILTGNVDNTVSFSVIFGRQPSVQPAIPFTIQLLPATVFNVQVVDSYGTGVANANVNIQPAWNTTTHSRIGVGARTQTDTTGNFSASLADGQYNISINTIYWDPITGQNKSIPGVIGGSVDQRGTIGTPATFDVVSGVQPVISITIPSIIQLLPVTIFSGQVVDSYGTGVANANISINPVWNATAHSNVGVAANAQTDATGNFSVSLADGQYTISIDTHYWDRITGQQKSISGVSGGSVDQYGTIGTRATFDVVFGKQLAIPTIIQLLPAIAFDIHLVDSYGTGVANAKISINAVGNANTSGLVGTIPQATDAAGNFSVWLGEGQYTISIDTNYWDRITGQQKPIPGVIGGGVDQYGTIGTQMIFYVVFGLQSTIPTTIQLLPATGSNGQVVDSTGTSVVNGNSSSNLLISASMRDLYVQPGGTFVVPVTITPSVETALSLYHVHLFYDGYAFTRGGVNVSGIPSDWSYSVTDAPVTPDGFTEVVISGASGTGTTLTTPFTIYLTYTAASSLQPGNVYAMSIRPSSFAITPSQAKVTLTNVSSQLLIANNMTLTIPLLPGWNMFGVPVAMEQNRVAVIFANISGLESVWALDRMVWEDYVVGVPEILNSLSILSPGKAYWVKLSRGASPQTITLSGAAVASLLPNKLTQGWNMVATDQVQNDVGGWLSKIGATSAWNYNGGSWRSFISGSPVFLNSLRSMQPGEGYYVWLP